MDDNNIIQEKRSKLYDYLQNEIDRIESLNLYEYDEYMVGKIRVLEDLQVEVMNGYLDDILK